MFIHIRERSLILEWLGLCAVCTSPHRNTHTLGFSEGVELYLALKDVFREQQRYQEEWDQVSYGLGKTITDTSLI